MIVDFDQTLCLENSTEAFVGAARPALLAAILFRALDLLAPWRWWRGAVRDAWRVALVRWLFPGVARRWGRRPPALNEALCRALAGRRWVIASNGFAPVIAPMLAAAGLADVPLIACRNSADVRAGKLARLRAAGFEAADALVVTDDPVADAALLAACAVPLVVTWRGAVNRRAFAGTYIPGDYLVHIKRPGQTGARRQLVTDDLVFWVLGAASGGMAPGTWPGVALLFVSFWAIYEVGYFDNDRCAVAREDDPVVSTAFADVRAAWLLPAAILWALVCGAVGIAWLGAGWGGAACWGLCLAALIVVFGTFNRLDKASRVWLYPALAGLRSLGYLAVLPAGAAGLAAGLAQIFSRFLGYFLYRYIRVLGVCAYPALPLRAVQTILLLIGLAAFGRHGGLGWPAAAMVVWSILLARRELGAIARQARWLRVQPGGASPGH